jgi:hypothetical protein
MSEELEAPSSEEEAEVEECESMSRDRILERFNSVSNGNEVLAVLALLPNTAQRWSHSITTNAIIKVLCCSPVFKDQCDSFYVVKVKKGVETKVLSTFNSLSLSLQSALFNVPSQVSPYNGPWEQVIQLLHHCEEAFYESAAATKQAGMSAYWIACGSHILTDERVIPLLVKAAEAFDPSERPAALDHQKATGSSCNSVFYADVFKNYKAWKKDYVNQFTEGLFSEDLKGMMPHLARFKDAEEIRKLTVHVVSRVETILRNHQQSGHHSSGNKRLEKIRYSFLSPKGKNVDIPFFYAFLMLETTDSTFVSRKLGVGVGASAGFGTVGGDKVVSKSRKRKHGGVSTEIKEPTKNLAEQAERITSNINNAITKLFSPFSPQPHSFSESIASASSSSQPVDTFQLEREEKVKTEHKIKCIKEQMDFC